ncbi:Sir2 family NAD-dependent protein deacetylase [Escherichia coli]
MLLAKLQDALGDRFLLVTQNIDNLHERAGNTNVIHMHGELLEFVVRKVVRFSTGPETLRQK